MIKVLIVDDDNLVRKGLMSLLPWKLYGMEVVGEAKNGEKALEFLSTQKVDLVFTDLAMPVMSGMELMRVIRKKYPSIFIVVLTLHQDFEYIQDCLRLGAIDYVAKVELETENYDDVMNRIKNRIVEEQTKNAAYHGLDRTQQNDKGFYTTLPGQIINEETIEIPRLTNPVNEEMLADLKKSGLTLAWVHKMSEFDTFLEKLKEASLPPAKLIALLNSLLVGWNQIYASVTHHQIELPESFDAWYEVEEWLYQVRDSFSAAIGKSQYSVEVQECITRAAQTMHDELSEQVTASEMAKRVNMSRSYFSQCFKDIMGMTFNEYLRSIRIEKAKEYLQFTQKNIQWISENTGYTDQKYFSRVFYKLTGVLPSEYRQSIQSGNKCPINRG